ncbi:hypothetical protein JY651_17630 [Pyxidicoccus parkwayensis]|uniref:Uncharacterized protein n=1 Tax=Pyxidicoccus parkwayensis TaxID=2813578 RepID=A0ABX7P862_9BACT|nr:hypothetical protein [Pyxidicoccus parkwaysis]QSQ26636.1 hypothetical protein JY651_17630 [Pyxidicoccus parkwaysis]
MGFAPVGGSGTSGFNPAEAARRAEAARQQAEAARRAAEAARKAAEEARRAAEAARRDAEAARQQQAAAQKAAANAQQAARKPGQTPEAAKKSQADAAAAAKALQQASEKVTSTNKALQAAEEKVALTAKQAQEGMGRANSVALQEKKTPPFTQKDLDGIKPKANELVSAFEGTNRRAELEKLLGTARPPRPAAQPKTEAPPTTGLAPNTQTGEKPPASLDAVDAKDIEAARKLPDGQTYTDPSSGAKYQVKKNATSGEMVLSDPASGNTVTVKPDGSYTSTVTAKEQTQSGGSRETSWTKSADALGRPTGLESRKSQTEQHPETGNTTTTSTTKYDTSRSPPVPRSRTEEVRMEKPPAELARQPGAPQGPATVKTETEFNAQGLPAKQVKTTQVQTPGFKADDVNAFEAGQNTALQNASKGEGHHKANNAPTSLKPGESSLTITEETRFNAQGEPAVSTQKSETVATQPLKTDKNGNGVLVVRTQQEVTRGPKDAASTDSLPAISSSTPGNITQRTTATGYDPDGSRFKPGHASRTQTVSQASGTVDANGQPQLQHQPTEVKSLQEANDNRWKYDHVSFEAGADGKPVPGKEPKQLDKERQLPWYDDAKDFVVDGLIDLANAAGDIAGDALNFAKEALLKPVDAVLDQATAPVEGALADEIKKLNSPGDALTLSGGLSGKVGLKGGLDGEIEVEMTSDGKYQLSAEVTGDFGVGLVASASVSAGGRMEMTFDTPEEAARAALIMGKGPAAIASGGEDQKFMQDHLTAMEVNLGVQAEAGLGGKAGPFNAELSASIGATQSYRVEFEKGKPTYLVSTVEIEGSAAGSIAAGFKDKLGGQVGGELSGTVSLETRIPIDRSKVDTRDVMAFISNPVTAALVDSAETTISIEGSRDLGKEGKFFTTELSGLSGKDLQGVAKKLMNGEFETAFDGVQYESKTTEGSYKDDELGFSVKLGVVDVELNARHRDMTAEGSGGDAGPKVEVGGEGEGGGTTRRNHGSHGSSGSSGASGGSRSTGGSGGTSGSNGASGGSGSAGGRGGTSGSNGAPAGSNSPTSGSNSPASGSNSPTSGNTGPASGSNGPTGRPPATRLPPTEFRLNPATGQLMPVAPRDGGPPRTTRTERPGSPELTGGRPDATTAPGDTRATSERPVPVVRNPELPGRTTRVRYDNGQVRIEAGPAATPEDIQAHMETARVLQRYEGARGKVRQLIDKVKQVLTGMPGYGSQGFESRLEVRKLNNILQSLQATQRQLETMTGATGNATPAQRADLERQIASVERQLRTHEAQVYSLDTGRGYVAREDDTAGPPPGTGTGRPARSPEERAFLLLAAQDEYYVYPPGNTALERMQAPAREWEVMPFNQFRDPSQRQTNLLNAAAADVVRLREEASRATGPERTRLENEAREAERRVRSHIRRRIPGHSPDHIPSNAAMETRQDEGNLIDMRGTGRPRDLDRESTENEGNSMIVTFRNHRLRSETYGGKNLRTNKVTGEKRWLEDARNPEAAVMRDSRAYLEHLRQTNQLTPAITADFIRLYWSGIVNGTHGRSEANEEMLLDYLDHAEAAARASP